MPISQDVPVVAPRTAGISPKVWAPCAALILAVAVQWVATGEFDRAETATLLAAAGQAVIGYLAGPGEIVAQSKAYPGRIG